MRFPTLSIAPDTVEQNVADGWSVKRQRDFRGGENLASLPEVVGRDQFIRMENATISPQGRICSWWKMDVPAMTHTSDIKGVALSPISDDAGVFHYFHTSGVTDQIIAGSFTTLSGSVTDLSAGTAHDLVGASIVGFPLVIPFLGKLYCPGGAGGVLNLTDYALITDGILTDKVVLKLLVHDNRLWAITEDGVIIFSDNGDAAHWNVLNIIGLPNSEVAIDFVPVDSGIIITHRNGAYALFGSGTYQDTSIREIKSAAKDPVLFSDSAVVVGNAVYLIGNRGLFRVTLNGMEEIPHSQGEYFNSLYNVWNSATFGKIQGAYLYKHRAILYLFQGRLNLTNDVKTNTLINDESEPSGLTNDRIANSGMLFYIDNMAICKTTEGLDMDAPFLLPINDESTDFLTFASSTVIGKSQYPPDRLSALRQSVIQTRHEDCDSIKDKVWASFSIEAGVPIYDVRVRYFLNGSATPFDCGIKDLVPGNNTFDLYDANGNPPQSKSISFEITIGGLSTSRSAAFTINELSLQYRETGEIS